MNMADDVSVTLIERLRSGVVGDRRIHEDAGIEVCNLQCDIKILIGLNTSTGGIGYDSRDHVCRRWDIAHGYQSGQ